MNKNINIVTLVVAILGAVKLILESVFKIDVISDAQIDAIANGVAAIVTIVGIFLTHQKPVKEQAAAAQPEQYDIDNMV